MADNTFDPTESLGPEFGKINPQNINPESLKPFEGDTPSFPEFYQEPLTADFKTLRKKNADINKVNKGVPTSYQEKFNGIEGRLLALGEAPPEQHSRIFSYNAGASGNNFYKRYAAYGPEKFEKLGFSPMRDNEALYNANTSWWENTSVMISNSMAPLFTKGFTDTYESLFKALKGDFSVNLESAKEYAEAAAIGQSSKDGFGAFMSNTAMSFAYTAGIFTSAILEEIAGTLLTPATGGASFFAATANNLRKIRKIGATADLMYDGTKAVNQTMKGLNNVSNARTFWGTSVGRVINPFENVRGAIQDIKKAESVGDNINNLAKLSKTAGGFYRDVRNANMALSEARLEGGFVQNELYQELYDEHYNEFHEAPTNEVQEEMTKQAKAAGTNALLWNTAIIFASNKILLPNVLGSNRGLKKALSSKISDVIDLETGKVVFKKTVKGATKEGAKKTAAKGAFEYTDKSFKNTLKNFSSQPFGTSVKGFMGYFKANVSEGLQENAQDVIADFSKNYYKQMYVDESVITSDFSKGLLTNAIDAQLSAQGFETFASGFMMGMFAKPMNAVVNNYQLGYNKIFNKDVYTEYKNAKAKTGKDVAAALNEFYSDPKDFFESKLFNQAIQNSVNDISKDSPKMETMDAREEGLIQKVALALDTNSMDFFVEHLESMKGLTPEEFEEAFGFEKGTGKKYQDRIDSIISRARSIERTHKNIKEKFPSPVNLDDYEKGTETYNKASIFDSAWKLAQRNALFFNESFTNTVSRMESIMQDFSTELDFSKISSTDLNSVFDLERLSNEKDILSTEIEGLKLLTDEKSKKRLGKLEKKLNAYTNFQEGLKTFNEYFFIKTLTPELREKARVDLEKNMGRKATDEEFDAALNEGFESYRNEENDTKAVNDFETQFKNYLKTIAELSDDHIFNKNIDEAFDKLVDYHRLSHQSRSMAFYANLLSSPIDFKDHVSRNYEWMSELYENRKDYYDQMVKDAMNNLEDNSLLNKLANDNIFLSPEDWVRFKKEGLFPLEFYDESRKKVITENSPDYAKYANLFHQKAALDLVETISKHPLRKALQEKRDELAKKMQAEIDELPKTETKIDLGAIKKPKLKKLSIKVVLKELQDKEYVTVTYKKGEDTVTEVFYRDGEELKQDNAEGKVLNIENITEKFESANKFKIVLKPEDAAVAEIEKEYAKKEAELIENFNKDNESDEYIPVTMYTPVNNLPATLKQELLDALENEMAITPGIYEGSPEDNLEAFMESDIATDILQKYNDTQEEIFNVSKEGPPVAPQIAIDGKILESSEMSDATIKNYIKRYQKVITDIESKEEQTDEDRLQFAEYTEVLGELSRYLTYRQSVARTQEMQDAVAKVERIRKLNENIRKTKEAYLINYVPFSRVTRSLEDLKEKAYAYGALDKVLNAYELTMGSGETAVDFMNLLYARTNELPRISFDVMAERAEVIEARLKAKKIDQIQIDRIYQQIESQQNELLEEEKLESSTPESIAEIRKQILDLEKTIPLAKEDAEATLTKDVNEATYREERNAGTYIDGLVRDYFMDVDKPFIWDSKVHGPFITQEAFDNTFNKGPLVKLRKDIKEGTYYIAAEGLILYDKNVRIAGEIDLLLVDKFGQFHIVDLKTGADTKWSHFTKTGGVYPQNSKTEAYELQQTAYKNLLFNMIGVEATINLMPLLTKVNINTGKIESSSINENLTNRDTPAWFELNPSQDLIDKVNTKIPIQEEVLIDEKEELPAEVANALTETVAQDSDQVGEKEEEIIDEELTIYSTLDEMIGQNVYFEGKAYRLKKVNRKKKSARYELYSPTKTLYLKDVTGETTIDEAGLNLPKERENILSRYKIEMYPKPSIWINDNDHLERVLVTSKNNKSIAYFINVDKNNTVISLTPVNKRTQRIKNKALLIAVEIERNKVIWKALNLGTGSPFAEEDPITIDEVNLATEQENRIDNEVVTAILNKNMNETVADAINKVYDPEKMGPLTESEKLALDLWVTNAQIDLTKLYVKNPKPLYGRALDNLEIINILLYTENNEIFKRTESSNETTSDESTEGSTEINPRKQKKGTKPKKEIKPTEPAVKKITLAEVKVMIAKTNNVDQLRGELLIAFQEGKIDAETVNKMSGLLTARTAELDEGTNIEIALDNLEEGTQLIVKNDIFEGEELFAEQYDTVVVTKIQGVPEYDDDGQASSASYSVTVTLLSTGESKTFSNPNEYFTTVAIFKTKAISTSKPLDESDKQLIKQTSDSVKLFAESGGIAKDSINDVADSSSIDDIEKDLLNDLLC